jgi:hypothetical protein
VRERRRGPVTGARPGDVPDHGRRPAQGMSGFRRPWTSRSPC